MFKEPSIKLRVGYRDRQTDPDSDIPIYNVIKSRTPLVYAFSKSGVALKSKFIVNESNQTKERAVINRVELNDQTFRLEIFCLYEARVVNNSITYESQL
jgi:hypothetical protein